MLGIPSTLFINSSGRYANTTGKTPMHRCPQSNSGVGEYGGPSGGDRPSQQVLEYHEKHRHIVDTALDLADRPRISREA